jgi:hypothetical protein
MGCAVQVVGMVILIFVLSHIGDIWTVLEKIMSRLLQ